MSKLRKKITTHIHRAQINLAPKKTSPDVLWGELFQDVQLHRIFEDSITFADMIPAAAARQILKDYRKEREDPHFDLHDFVERHFQDIIQKGSYTTNRKHTIEQHIEELWGVLQREIPKNTGSLIGLPYPYEVAGGRFIAQYYWDSYFVMLGLAAGDHWNIVEGMVKNCVFLIRKFGYIPNASRTYNSTRSQPPVFALMVRLLADHSSKRTLVKYLPYLIAEHNFWMKGSRNLGSKRVASLHAVRMPDGSILNRYFETATAPRPESYKEDLATALRAKGRTPSRVYVDLRAGAESGWDFSSRWFKDPNDIATICTTNMIPVDLNCLMVTLEQTIADAYSTIKQNRLAQHYENLAQKRIEAIRKYCWDSHQKFFTDYNFAEEKSTGVISAAGLFPLFCNVATNEQASDVSSLVAKKLLQPGGIVTSLNQTEQQWDWPNGWAPLQWVAIQGLRNYGYKYLADEIKERWIKCNVKLYEEQGKLVEKYNVVDINSHAGGGEYELQDGFGWTNGVLLALLREET